MSTTADNGARGYQALDRGNFLTNSIEYRTGIVAADASVAAFTEDISFYSSHYGYDNQLIVWVDCSNQACVWSVELWMQNPATSEWHYYVTTNGNGNSVYTVRYLPATKVKLLVSAMTVGTIDIYESHSA
jgi:hypothetical protein